MEESIKKVWAKMKEHKKASIIGAAVIVVLLIVIAVNSSSNGFYTIDVAQNYKLECSGDSGDATANASIATDKDDLVESILFKLYPNSSDDYVKGDIYSSFLSGLDFTYNKKDHISNGDEITATANYDKNKAKELKLKLKNTTLKTTASDLYEYINANTNITDQLKESLDETFNHAISPSDSVSSSSPSYLGETNKAEDMWKALTNEEALWVTASTSEPINATEKYQLNPKNTSDPSQFIYFYTITLTHKYVIPSWNNDTATEEKTCVIAVSGKDLKYFYGSDGAYVKGSVAVVDKDTPCYKNIEEAKEKLLDKNSYDIKEI